MANDRKFHYWLIGKVISLTNWLHQWLEEHDPFGEAAPFTFDIELPEEVLTK